MKLKDIGELVYMNGDSLSFRDVPEVVDTVSLYAEFGPLVVGWGRLNRSDGPALMYKSGYKVWKTHGKHIRETHK